MITDPSRTAAHATQARVYPTPIGGLRELAGPTVVVKPLHGAVGLA